MTTLCTCPEYDHRRKKPVGPHFHLTVKVADLEPGDRLTVSEVQDKPITTIEGFVEFCVVYEGGAKAKQLYSPRQSFAITRPKEPPTE